MSRTLQGDVNKLCFARQRFHLPFYITLHSVTLLLYITHFENTGDVNRIMESLSRSFMPRSFP